MTRSPRPLARTLAVAGALVVVVAACDRACLAQSELFAQLRPALIDECCTCLAQRGTRAPGASCGEARLEGGAVVVPADAAVIPLDGGFLGEDYDDQVDADEIPCLCDGTAATCARALSSPEGRVLVSGACLEQADNFDDAPCEQECHGVLTFDPL